jgi:hypothetical protein
MRSLHVITTDARRGAETFAVQLVAALQQFGSDASVAAMGPSGSPCAYTVPVLGTAAAPRCSSQPCGVRPAG